MKFTLFSSLFYASALAANATDIQSDFVTVDANAKNWTVVTAADDGTVAYFGPFLRSYQRFGTSVNRTVEDFASPSPGLTLVECLRLNSYSNNTLEPDLKTLSNGLRAKATAWTNRGDGGLIYTYLGRVRSSFQKLSTEFQDECTKYGAKSLIVSTFSRIDADFASAQAAYA